MKQTLDEKFGGGDEDEDEDEADDEDNANSIVLDKIVTAFKETHGRDPSQVNIMLNKTAVQKTIAISINYLTI
jgi:hypothetical protein